jgi:hypothetical protein
MTAEEKADYRLPLALTDRDFLKDPRYSDPGRRNPAMRHLLGMVGLALAMAVSTAPRWLTRP